MAGMGARKYSDRKFVTGVATSADVTISSGVAAGRVVQPFPGMPGPAMAPDRVALFVWLILGGALLVAIGGHVTLGRYRIP